MPNIRVLDFGKLTDLLRSFGEQKLGEALRALEKLPDLNLQNNCTEWLVQERIGLCDDRIRANVKGLAAHYQDRHLGIMQSRRVKDPLAASVIQLPIQHSECNPVGVKHLQSLGDRF